MASSNETGNWEGNLESRNQEEKSVSQFWGSVQIYSWAVIKFQGELCVFARRPLFKEPQSITSSLFSRYWTMQWLFQSLVIRQHKFAAFYVLLVWSHCVFLGLRLSLLLSVCHNSPKCPANMRMAMVKSWQHQNPHFQWIIQELGPLLSLNTRLSPFLPVCVLSAHLVLILSSR